MAETVKNNGMSNAIIIGVGALIIGIIGYYIYQIKGALNYCYKFWKVRFNSMTKDLCDIDLTFKIMQNSNFRLQITGYSFDVFINNIKVSTVSETKIIDILPKAVSFFSANINFVPRDMFTTSDAIGLVLAATVYPENFNIKIVGNAKANLNGIAINMPLNLNMNLAKIMDSSNQKDDKKNMNCKIYGV